MVKKWLDPLDRLLEADEKSRSVKEYLQHQTPDKAANNQITPLESTSSMNETAVIDIDVKKIIRWKYKDRPENELGNIDELADTFKTIGQQQPCILRVSEEMPGKYELIVGERRWKAAEKAGVKLKGIVQKIDDKTAALIQAVENEKRSDISDFAKGMSYSDKIENGLITQKDLIEILGISKQQVSRLLSFSKIPSSLFNAIEDFRKVSSRTAYEIARYSAKGDEYIEILINLAPKIRSGKCGHSSIAKEMERKEDEQKKKVNQVQKIFNLDGRHLFTWRLDNNSAPSIHFPKDIVKLIDDETINFEEITKDIKDCIAAKLAKIKS